MKTRTTSTWQVIFSLLLVAIIGSSMPGHHRGNVSAQALPVDAPASGPIPTPNPTVEEVNPYFSIEHRTLADGRPILGYIIHGPSAPLPEYEAERIASIRPASTTGVLLDFPSFSWVFGCSAVSGAMIATYYDRGAYPNMYTGPTNGGVMPLTDTAWPIWFDGYSPYPNNPLIASHLGVDGLATRGSIDDYWVKEGSDADDPYITGGWLQHTWGTAIGDYMKTSQSAYESIDGSTWFYNWPSNERLTCSDMVTQGVADSDGTYGRKLFYEARGYTVTECYNQRTDNSYAGGYSLADFQAEINAGHPVLLNLKGHSIVGYGYDGSTIYIRDTWNNNPAVTYTMPWGGFYEGMELLSVSVVRLAPVTPVGYRAYLPIGLKQYLSGQRPTDILLSNSSVIEGLPVNTVVGTLSSVDPNIGDTFTYSLVSGTGDTGNASFNILDNQLRTSAVFDYETQNSYSIRIRTTDQDGLFFEKAFTITITNIVEGTILNGDFEQGHVAWTEYSSNGWDLIVLEDPDLIDVPVLAHNGSWLAWLGGYEYETSRLYQTFSVPAGTSILHYWYWSASEDLCGWDYFRIKVNGTTLYTRNLCDDTNTGGWVEASLNLTAYANTTITLMFEVTMDDILNSNLFLDDVSLSSTLLTSPEVALPGGGDVVARK